MCLMTNSIWSDQWWPIAYIRDLSKRQPNSFTLLDQDIVIWWNRLNKKWCVFADICPHRLAPLSDGRISENGFLECPYHGWKFTGEGMCQSIPHSNKKINENHKKLSCKNFPSEVEQGLLFVWTGPPNQNDISLIPTAPYYNEESKEWEIQDTFRDLPIDCITLLENVIDVSHVSFTHHGTIARRTDARAMNVSIIKDDISGFQAVWEEGPRCGYFGPEITTFNAPHQIIHQLGKQATWLLLTIVYITPISKGRCRLIYRMMNKPTRKKKLFSLYQPMWIQHLRNHTIHEDEHYLLYKQEYNYYKACESKNNVQAYCLPSQSDLYVILFHRWLDSVNGGPFDNKSLPERQYGESFLDRYYSHTILCHSCSTALRRIKLISKLLLVICFILTIVILSRKLTSIIIFYSAILLILAIATLKLKSLEKALIVGDGKLLRKSSNRHHDT